MRRCEKENIYWLEFESLACFPRVVHGVFLCARNQPVEETESLWIEPAVVASALGVEQLQPLRNAHGKQVHIVDTYPSGGPSLVGDGVVTALNAVGLVNRHADCQVALFYDPTRHIIANIHCGWRGQVQNIYAETIQKMSMHYGCHPSNILVCIAPSLGPQRAEFIHYQQEFPPSFWRFQFKENYFNLWEIAQWQLEECGILPAHIEIAGLCTYSEAEDFFSYRRDKTPRRNTTVIALR